VIDLQVQSISFSLLLGELVAQSLEIPLKDSSGANVSLAGSSFSSPFAPPGVSILAWDTVLKLSTVVVTNVPGRLVLGIAPEANWQIKVGDYPCAVIVESAGPVLQLLARGTVTFLAP
jgi:hypothetical protein